MLDGILGRGFGSKCKSLIKATRTRIEVLRRRAEAKQRFLKEDLAKLLANGLDINAYGRTEEFLAGLNLLACYDFIEHSCEYVLKQLSIIQKQRECPEECREAVSSLMFAAARFSDLPELRDLRDMFQERYGNLFECFVNQKFVEKLSSKPPTMERRLQLLQDIVSEFSIKWDSRGFKQRMANPPALKQDQPKKYGPSHVFDDRYKLSKGTDTVPKADKHDVSSKERYELIDDGHRMHSGKEGNILRRDEVEFQFFGRRETTINGNKPLTSFGEIISKGEKNGVSSCERQGFTANKHMAVNATEDTPLKTATSGSSSHGKRLDRLDGRDAMHNGVNVMYKEENQSPLCRGKSTVSPNYVGLPFRVDGKDASPADNVASSQQNIVNSTRNVPEEEAERLKSYYNSALPPPYVKSKDNVIPPPYIKPKRSKHGASRGSKHAGSDSDAHSIDPSPHNRANAVNSSDRIQKGPAYVDHEGILANNRRHEKDRHYQDDIPLPKPRSTRRKHSKSSSNHDDASNFEDAGVVKRSSSNRRREHSRKGLQILFDDEHYRKDEDERMIDKLLLHYSKKPSPFEVGKLRKKSEAHSSHQIATDAGESSHNRTKDGPDMKPEMVPQPTRSISLPHEQTAPSEATNVFARANSFQQDNQARHVHPKLPDYDDLAARFAALRGQ